jgi:hypothetical protein
MQTAETCEILQNDRTFPNFLSQKASADLQVPLLLLLQFHVIQKKESRI